MSDETLIEICEPTLAIISDMRACKMTLIEECGRTAYQSQDKITEESHAPFIERIKRLGHTSVLEHSSITVRFNISRGLADELMRHRLTAITCQSTRYCDFSGRPIQFTRHHLLDSASLGVWDRERIEGDETSALVLAYYQAARNYKKLRALGWAPQFARDVLPLGLHTEMVMTANAREWLHIFSLRTDDSAHPQLVKIMKNLESLFQFFWSPLF